MTNISSDDVLHLARLSSLSLDPEEVESLRVDLGNILDYISELSQLDTTGVTPTYQVTGLSNIMRDDVVEHDVDREALLALAPAVRDHQVQVPKVL